MKGEGGYLAQPG